MSQILPAFLCVDGHILVWEDVTLPQNIYVNFLTTANNISARTIQLYEISFNLLIAKTPMQF